MRKHTHHLVRSLVKLDVVEMMLFLEVLRASRVPAFDELFAQLGLEGGGEVLTIAQMAMPVIRTVC
jgi:hypothetical protein